MTSRCKRRTRAAACRRWLWPPAILLGMVLTAGCGSDPASDGDSTGLTDLAGIEALQEMFNRDAGVPRLILLLSPT